jgi:hypothetical protein
MQFVWGIVCWAGELFPIQIVVARFYVIGIPPVTKILVSRSIRSPPLALRGKLR